MNDREQGTCEVIRGGHSNPLQRVCDRPAELRYPAMGGGYMRLCTEHGAPHWPYCERWIEGRWIPGDVPRSTSETSRV